MELVEYAQAVDHSRMPLLLRVLNALGWVCLPRGHSAHGVCLLPGDGTERLS